MATSTSTEELIRDNLRLSGHARIDHAIAGILERYAPEDRYERSEFDRALIYLVRAVYEEAQAPVLKHLGAIAAAMPSMPHTLNGS